MLFQIRIIALLVISLQVVMGLRTPVRGVRLALRMTATDLPWHSSAVISNAQEAIGLRLVKLRAPDPVIASYLHPGQVNLLIHALC